jgi:hypothetical protein
MLVVSTFQNSRAPVLAEDVDRVPLSIHVEESNSFCWNSFSDTVKGQGCVSFVELGMDFVELLTTDFVISKHDTFVLYRYSKVMQSYA